MVLLGSCEVGLVQGAVAWCRFELGRKGRGKNTWAFDKGSFFTASASASHLAPASVSCLCVGAPQGLNHG